MVARVIKSDQIVNIHEKEQKTILKVSAGPGAGKTHWVITNIKDMIQNAPKLVNSERKILCITYTNVAANEIKKRLGPLNEYVFVGTIHAFISQFILRPYQLQLKQLLKDKFKINIDENKKILMQREGYQILSGVTREEIIEYTLSLDPEKNVSNISKRSMNSVELDIDKYNERDTDNTTQNVNLNDLKSMSNLNRTTKKLIKKYMWEEVGVLSFDEALILSLMLVREFEFIPYLIRSEFPYILIDEYQDTNPVQNKIIKEIVKEETHFTVIGDVAQSIYSFQGADYREFKNIETIFGDVKEKVIEGNRRSSQNIIHFINYLRQADDSLKEQSINNDIKCDKKVKLIISNSNDHMLDNKYLKDSVVLVRRTNDLFNYIQGVNQNQKQLIKRIHNFYTFRLNRPIQTEIELRRESWINAMVWMIDLKDATKRKCIPSTLNLLDEFIDSKDLLLGGSEGKAQLETIFGIWQHVEKDIKYYQDMSVIKAIEKTHRYMASVFGDSDIIENKISELFSIVDLENDFEDLFRKLSNLSYHSAEIMLQNIYSSDPKYMTIHRAKGMEFPKVLVDIQPFAREPEKSMKMVDILLKPNIFASNNTLAELTRIMYVGASRAEEELIISIKGEESDKKKLEEAFQSYAYEQKTNNFVKVLYLNDEG